MGRPPVGTPDWAPEFIGALMMGHSIIDSAIVAGVDPRMPYHRRSKDEQFKEAWREAATIGTELLEQEAARRAYHGTMEPVFNKGVECGLVRKYSDTLMIFLLKARKPDTYRDTPPSVVVHNNNKNVNVSVFDDIEKNVKLIEQATNGTSPASATSIDTSAQVTLDTSSDSHLRANGAAEPIPEAQSDSAEGEPEAD